MIFNQQILPSSQLTTIIRLFTYVLLRSHYQQGWDPVNWFNLPHFCTCINSTSYVMFFFLMFNELRWEEIVRFVDNGGIVRNGTDILRATRKRENDE
jgi:hypothetical protein